VAAVAAVAAALAVVAAVVALLVLLVETAGRRNETTLWHGYPVPS